MAQFEEAVSKTLLWEGGYANDANDSGKETYRGVSRANWPLWSGWIQIDLAKAKPNFPQCLESNSSLQAVVVQFYRKNFWCYDGLINQTVADKIFDLSVNVGKPHAHKIVQRIVGITEDGVWGPETERSVNAIPTSNGSFLTALRLASMDYHKQIVIEHPEDAKFLDGWLRRDQS